MRADQVARKMPPGYDRLCRNLTDEERAQIIAEGIKPVVRFKVPLEGQTGFHDYLRGDVVFENSTIDDFVLLKSDGYPTYHLANIIDDHYMQISHVLRAEEWISSTPRHIMLYKAVGFEPPVFAHLPMILGPDRSKLSKRHGATALTEYRDAGYLPETMLNFLALLGWSLDEKTELFSREGLIENFSIDRVSRTAAIFNKDKLDWMNGVYIRNLQPDDFCKRIMPVLEQSFPADIKRPINEDYVKSIIPLIHERTKTLKEVPELMLLFFEEELKYEASELIIKGTDLIRTREIYAEINKIIDSTPLEHTALEKEFRELAAKLEMKAGPLFTSIRNAMTGRPVTPPLFETMEVLGSERVNARLSAAIKKLG